MNTATQSLATTKEHALLKTTITDALKKLGEDKELSLCHYIPALEGSGYIHHFTLRKLKREEPSRLTAMINEHIITPQNPRTVPPKARAPRGSRKRKDALSLNHNAVERLLYLARNAGDNEAIALLQPQRSLANCKRELVQAIRRNRIDQSLWNCYVETIRAIEGMNAAIDDQEE